MKKPVLQFYIQRLMVILGILSLTTGLIYGRSVVVNGIPWYDQRDSIVSAHGANILLDNGRYYMFGEFKTDSVNDFKGFSCYSSDDLVNWRFERMVLGQQTEGSLGPGRVGERPKVLKCPSTGEYIMVMHSDDKRYKDPCTTYATSPTVNGDYTFRGPLLYKGNPIRKWDIGTFVDDDGAAYLLVHHGDIYRFAEDFHSLDSCMVSKVAGVGESPAMLRHNDKYYWFSSHTTSWERNDNMYFTADSLCGPWEKHEFFAPEGTNTWNSQTSFILSIRHGDETVYMYMGDRWSFPKQRSAATYVWLPIQWVNGQPTLPEYWEAWSPDTMSPFPPRLIPAANTSWTGMQSGQSHHYTFDLKDGESIYLQGTTDVDGGYAEVTIANSEGVKQHQTVLDFYSLTPASGLRYISPELSSGTYSVTIKVSEMKSNWSDKRRNQYGSKGYKVNITEAGTIRK